MTVYCMGCNLDYLEVKPRDKASSGSVRLEVATFAEEMETKLRRNDHKRGWRDLPVEALFRLLMIELEEFRVADEFLNVADARKELVDLANFCLILHDRLGLLQQDRNRHAQPK